MHDVRRLRGRLLVIATSLLAVLGAPLQGVARQADDAVLEPGVNLVVPQRRAWLHDPRHASIEIKSVEVTAKATEQVASTTIRLTLFNPASRQAEARVLLPVPDGAAVGSLTLEGLGEDGIAKIMSADEARRIYNAIVASLRDPALLEFVGTGLVQTSVFPVPAKGEQVVRLTYEHTLEADGDRIEYVLPRSAELMVQGAPWSFSMDVRSARPISTAYSPTHDMANERKSATHVRVSVAPQAFSGTPGGLRVGWIREPLEPGVLASSFLAYPEPDGGGYFMLVAGPPSMEKDRPEVKREVTLVIDKSGSMRGEKIEQAREAAIQVIEALDTGEFFNILAYSDTIERFSEHAVAKSSQTTTEVLDFVRSINAVGGTNIHDALLAALRPEPAEDVLPMILFLTDGLPTVGVTKETDIREAIGKSNAHQRRIFGFGVGYDVNAPLLTAISRDTRGAPSFVLPQEDVEVKVGQVFRRLTGPVLALPELKPDDPTNIEHMLPAELPDIFEGDQIIVLGLYASEEDTLRFTLQGQAGDQHREFELEFDPKRARTEHAFVPRLWAQRRVAQLVEALRQAGADGQGEQASEELVEEIVRLSTRWGILTEYTAFLAIEPGVEVADQVAVGGVEADAEGAARLSMRMREAQASPSAPAERRAYSALQAAREERTGLGGVQQEVMNQTSSQAQWAMANGMRTAGGAQVIMTGMRQVGDQTLFARLGRWVDSSLIAAIDAEDERVDETVEFGTKRYFELARALAAENRHGVLALAGDIMLNRDGRIILVRAPGAEAP